MMFARNVHFNIKSGKNQEFTRILQSDVLPVLKRQKGFKEELALVNGDTCMAISVWEDRPSAENYNTTTFPLLLQKLNTCIDGTPKVDTYEVPLAVVTA